MRLTKMHGAGNDYVYVDCFNQTSPERPDELARKISDRHFGVGGDGLILICPSESADARMRMFNADGSEAEMCGNGVRCVAKYVYDHGLCRNDRLRIKTGRGVLDLELEIADGKVHRVRVDMGEPILEPARIPVELPRSPDAARIVDFPADEYIPVVGQVDNLSYLQNGWRDRCGLDPRITCVSMGNPHAVMYCRDVASVPLEWLGPRFERLSIFPRRINVHFVQVESPSEVIMRAWERGSGATLACGTGACAVCVAGVLTGRTERKLLAHLPGGDLELDWADNNHVHLTGAAVEVFHGQWEERSV
ncbi:MAG: diaminopimelate epimerase [Pirellulales bacterium]|nr:diaminopimelate epimerase [Pirellulales bacterium]